MTGPQDKDDHDPDDFAGLHGPSESDIERFNREDAEYLDERKRDARTAVWKLIAGGVFMLLVASMFLNVLLPAFSRNRHIETGPERTAATVTQVFDGRTISVDVGGAERTVRYIGVETPLFGDRFYDLAIAANRQWLLGQDILLEADELDADREGRLLRYVWLDGAMINLNLIAVGLSKSADSGENNRYAEQLNDAQESAKASAIGIWEETGPGQSVSVITPGDGASGANLIEQSMVTLGPA